MRATPALRSEDLVYRYEPDVPALDGVSLTIPPGAFVSIVGQNGSGKTTLVKHFNALLKPTAGRVWVGDLDTRHATVAQLARLVGHVFQNPDHQIYQSSVAEEVAFGPRNLGWPEDEVHARTQHALAYFGLLAEADTPPAVLGYGLRRLVSIAAVYAMRPRVFVLDEPTAGLDRRTALSVLERLHALHQRGHTIIWVTHDMRLAAEHAPCMLVMHEGRVLAYGDTRHVLAQQDVLSRAQLPPPQVVALAQCLHLVEPDGPPLNAGEFAAAYARHREARR